MSKVMPRPGALPGTYAPAFHVGQRNQDRFGYSSGEGSGSEESDLNEEFADANAHEFFHAVGDAADVHRVVPESLFDPQPLAPALEQLPLVPAPIQPVPIAALLQQPRYKGLSGQNGKLYPYLFRCVNNPDGKDVAMVEWGNMSAAQIMALLNCKQIGSGKLKTMAFFAKAAVQYLLSNKNTLVVDRTTNARLAADLDAAAKEPRGVLAHPAIVATVVEACSSEITLRCLQTFLIGYNKTHPIVIKPGLFPTISATQQDQCRVAALMREPHLQSIFHAMANPPQDRSHSDNPELRLVALRTKLYEEFAEAFNNPAMNPTYTGDVAPWCDIDVDVSSPAEQRTWMWVAQTMRDIKTKMSTFIRNFMDSGKNANDLNHAARDLEFFQRFAKGNLVIMYAWLSWDHGRECPAWNSSLLPEDERLDLGDSSSDEGDAAAGDKDGGVAAGREAHVLPAPPAKKSKKDEPIVDRATLGAMVEMQKSLFEVALQKTSTDTTISADTVETSRSRAMDALCSQAAQVELLMKNACTPADLKATFTTHHRTLLERIIALISAPSS